MSYSTKTIEVDEHTEIREINIGTGVGKYEIQRMRDNGDVLMYHFPERFISNPGGFASATTKTGDLSGVGDLKRILEQHISSKK